MSTSDSLLLPKNLNLQKSFLAAPYRKLCSCCRKGSEGIYGKGPLAGYPVVNIKAVLYDGSYHDVDSNEMAFKIAAYSPLKGYR